VQSLMGLLMNIRGKFKKNQIFLCVHSLSVTFICLQWALRNTIKTLCTPFLLWLISLGVCCTFVDMHFIKYGMESHVKSDYIHNQVKLLKNHYISEHSFAFPEHVVPEVNDDGSYIICISSSFGLVSCWPSF
jgi:hypothetical protein